MPVTDADVGITELLGSHRPFRAVLKQTVDDFVVNEVLLSGEVAWLTRPPAFPPRTPAPSNSDSTPPSTGPSEPAAPREIPYASLDAHFPDEPAGTTSALVRDAAESDATELTLPSCPDKARRTAIHVWVREHLPAYVTDTVSVGDGDAAVQAVRLRKRDTCRPWKRRRTRSSENRKRPPPELRPRADALNANTFDPREKHALRERKDVEAGVRPRVDAGTYVSFFLWKRNTETMDALTILAKILRLPVAAFNFAGTKDKRAVTTQQIQVRGVSEGQLAHANRVLARRDRGFKSMAIGNVEILPKDTSHTFGLGDLRGNRFTLALRDLDVQGETDEENVRAAVNSLRTRGFVNYFGLQRFGSGVSGTHETGFAFLRRDFEEVCRRILLPLWIGDSEEVIRPERKRLITALERFAKREISAKELLTELPKWMHIERALAESFLRDEEHQFGKYAYKTAFSQLPRNVRRMYGHAVQSYLWNVMASARLRMSHPDDPSRMHAITGDLVLVNTDGKQELNYQTEVRSITEEEEKQKSVSIFRVMIPVLGSEVTVPNVAYGNVARQILAEQKIDLQTGLTSEYGMKGTYRPLLAKPLDMEMEIVSYSDSSERLIPSAVLQNSTTGDAKALPGTAENGHTLDQPHEGADKPIADSVVAKRRTQKVHGGAVSPVDKLVSDMKTNDPELENQGDSLPKKPGASNIPARQKKALVISFTLGCAEYATMLVRELTRKDSSTANQKAMQDGLREEG